MVYNTAACDNYTCCNQPGLTITGDTIICNGESTTLNASGSGVITWTNLQNNQTTSQTTITLQPVTSVSYMATATDANGCSSTNVVTVHVDQMPVLNLTKSNDIQCGQSWSQLSAGTTAQMYEWIPAIGLSSNTISNPIATPLVTTSYTLTATNGACIDSASIIVMVDPGSTAPLSIPNAFSPNGDGLNDCLKVLGPTKYKSFYFAIYNRWGQKVFETDDASICWDGTMNGKPVSPGTYFYYIKAETHCEKIFRKGDITLLD